MGHQKNLRKIGDASLPSIPKTKTTAPMLASQIKHGDIVTIVTPRGQKIRGRATMYNPKVSAWVLNTGGRYGVPALADVSNVIGVKKG